MKDKRDGYLQPRPIAAVSWRSKLAVVWFVAGIIAVGFVFSHVQVLLDYTRLYNYQPQSQIVQLADQTTMTAAARHLFYVNHPQIDSRQTFNAECKSGGEQTIVLGCYHPVDRGIYVFGVTDIRLDGVEQVTAAHEMLHAAYDRLSTKDRQKVDSELQQFYDNHVTDSRIRSTMAAYQKSEPRDVVNEMHSIFATEIPTLTPELETYYRQYFTNRSSVVQFASTYQQEFTSRQDQVASYDKQLADLKVKIDANTAVLKTREGEINDQQRQMESYKASSDYEAYNIAVPVYNGRVDQYNSLVRITQNEIAEYNRLVADRNSIAVEERDLTRSISSQITPINQ